MLFAFAGQVAWSFMPARGQQSPDPEEGRALYQANCSTCHGLSAEGTVNGPTLQGVGSAAVDFMLSSGRMPLAAPGDQPDRQRPKFSEAEIAAIVEYLSLIAPGGPGIPDVSPASGDLSEGAQLFLNNCSACHGAAAVGDSVGGGQIAPSLMPADATQVGEAIRIGPGLMPRFDPDNLSDDDLDAIAAYLAWLRDNGSEGGLQIGRIGAVAEGLIALVVGLGLLILFLRLTGSKV